MEHQATVRPVWGALDWMVGSHCPLLAHCPLCFWWRISGCISPLYLSVMWLIWIWFSCFHRVSSREVTPGSWSWMLLSSSRTFSISLSNQHQYIIQTLPVEAPFTATPLLHPLYHIHRFFFIVWVVFSFFDGIFPFCCFCILFFVVVFKFVVCLLLSVSPLK